MTTYEISTLFVIGFPNFLKYTSNNCITLVLY